MKKNYDDITVVVQGPVQTFQDRPQEPNITHKCLTSIREYLPGATIILSTWPNQELEGLDYDQLVISEDPGANCRHYTMKGEPQFYNNNRQIVSSREGLLQVKTKYALKLRSDNYLTSNNFVELQKSYQARAAEHTYLKERVVVSDTFTRRYAKGLPVAFHLSDFFYFGLTEDVLAFWNIPLFEEFQPTSSVPINEGFPDYVIDCTQALCLAAFQQFDSSIQLKSLLDNSPKKIELSEKCYANNLVIAPPEILGLGLCQKFLGKARVSRTKGKCTHYQFFEWQALYKQYCDPTLYIDSHWKKRCKLFLVRCLHAFPTRFETVMKIKKRARRSL